VTELRSLLLTVQLYVTVQTCPGSNLTARVEHYSRVNDVSTSTVWRSVRRARKLFESVGIEQAPELDVIA
jgi:hypothetical protein